MANSRTDENVYSEPVIERSSLDDSLGTILLIHGSAPFNADGIIQELQAIYAMRTIPSSEIFNLERTAS
jgi:hypothetical protein